MFCLSCWACFYSAVSRGNDPAKVVATALWALAWCEQHRPGTSHRPVATAVQKQFSATATHVGLGALVGKLIVGVTLAGFDATPNNVAKLVALAHKEDAAARAALGASGDQ